MLGYELVAGRLVELGIDTVFGVMGDGNMHWLAAYQALPGTTYGPAWHEAGAVGMADGWAAARGPGAVGVASVTMGPGLVQALGAVTAAARTCRPLLVITSQAPLTVPGQAQWADQRGWVEATGARYLEALDPDTLALTLDDALAAAANGSPVVLSIDLALFEREVAAPAAVRPPAAGVATTSQAQLGAAVAALQQARTPVLVVGRGALSPAAVEAASELAARIGATLATTVPANGAFAGSDRALGLTGMMASPVSRSTLAGADVVLVLGANLDRYNTDGGTGLTGSTVVRVDQRPPAELWDPPSRATLHVTGDAAAVLRSLLERLPPASATGADRGGFTDFTAVTAAERERVAELATRECADGPNPWAVVEALDQALPDDAYVVVGIGHFWYFVTPYLGSGGGRRFQFGHGFAMIGQALPLGVGAAVARPGGPVVVIEGDGSIPMNLVELQTAVRLGVDLLVVVLDNAAYGSEIHKLALAGLDPEAAAFARPLDLVAVATAMGARAVRADGPAAVRAAVADLLAAPGVRLLVTGISRSTMSEVYERQHG
jgi:acetolactate synthase I/II/III large subunit